MSECWLACGLLKNCIAPSENNRKSSRLFSLLHRKLAVAQVVHTFVLFERVFCVMVKICRYAPNRTESTYVVCLLSHAPKRGNLTITIFAAPKHARPKHASCGIYLSERSLGIQINQLYLYYKKNNVETSLTSTLVFGSL